MNMGGGGWIILLSVVVAVFLSIMQAPFAAPDWLQWLRPHWILLVLFFWGIATPMRMGLVWPWLLGIFFDVLVNEPIGLNAACFLAVAYIAERFHERLRMYSIVQQAGILFVLAVSVGFLRSLAWALVHDVAATPLFIASAAMTALVFLPVAMWFSTFAYRVRPG